MDPHQRRRRRSTNNGPSLGNIASAAIAAYGTYRLANWVWSSWYDDKQEDEAETNPVLFTSPSPRPTRHQWRQRQQRVRRCREEVMKAIHGFLPTLQRATDDKTSTTKETQLLKQIRAERDTTTATNDRVVDEAELWDTIKIKAMTRLMATAYAHTILFLVVTVQVNLLGGKLFQEQLSAQKDATTTSISTENSSLSSPEKIEASHKLVLQHTYEYFFEHGLQRLIKSVERSVQTILADWNVADASSLNITQQDLDQAIHSIRALQEQGRGRQRSLLRYLMSLEEDTTHTVPDDLARWILEETWDLLESPVLVDAQQDCLDCTLDKMRDEGWSKIFEDAESRPLAHILTRLKHTSKSFFKKAPMGMDGMTPPTVRFTVNSYCSEMELLPAVLELADISFN